MLEMVEGGDDQGVVDAPVADQGGDLLQRR
jgi:hypothetical protein